MGHPGPSKQLPSLLLWLVLDLLPEVPPCVLHISLLPVTISLEGISDVCRLGSGGDFSAPFFEAQWKSPPPFLVFVKQKVKMQVSESLLGGISRMPITFPEFLYPFTIYESL